MPSVYCKITASVIKWQGQVRQVKILSLLKVGSVFAGFYEKEVSL